jgi:glycosyltransferase involved in cell wall biosynthesis
MGINVLLDAWSQVVAQLPGPARLLIAGNGELFDALNHKIGMLGLAECTTLLGRVDDATLVDLFRAADLGVVPTLEHEGFGLIVVEAGGCGTPSVVTDVGGLPETVADLDGSLVVPANDPDALASRLLSAALDGELPSRSRTRIAAEQFDWTRVAQLHLALYAEVLSDR